MPRKDGDKNYANYVGYQAFSSDEPTHRINYTNWYLKWEHKKPAFFLQVEKVFKQIFELTNRYCKFKYLLEGLQRKNICIYYGVSIL